MLVPYRGSSGQVQQYYVEGSHEGIINANEFDIVQAEIARRKRLGRSFSGTSIFATKLICSDCGGYYGQKVWHSNDTYRRIVWQCNGKFKRDHKCQTATLTACTIQQMFLKAYSQMMQNREQVVEDCETMQHILTDCSEIDAKIARLTEEMAVVAGLVSTGIRENASNPLSQEEFNEKRNTLVKRYERLEAKVKKLEEDKIIRRGRERELKMFIDAIRSRPLVLDEWDEEVWLLLLEKGTVFADGHINYVFKNGTVITVGAE